jgi:hypothetical protein
MNDGSSFDETRVPRKTARHRFVIFMLGLVVGIVGTVVVPDLVRPRLPFLSSEGVPLAGVVSGKQTETDRLLLTLLTPDGTILATFTEEVAEVGLLIQPGDSVTLEVREYAPFLDDPTIARVVPGPRLSGAPSAEQTETTQNGERAGPAAADSADSESDTTAMPTLRPNP